MSEDTLCTGGGGRGSLLDVCDASILICVLEDLSLGGMAGDLEGEGGMGDKAEREVGVSSGVFTAGSTTDDSGCTLIALLYTSFVMVALATSFSNNVICDHFFTGKTAFSCI